VGVKVRWGTTPFYQNRSSKGGKPGFEREFIIRKLQQHARGPVRGDPPAQTRAEKKVYQNTKPALSELVPALALLETGGASSQGGAANFPDPELRGMKKVGDARKEDHRSVTEPKVSRQPRDENMFQEKT